MSSPAPVRVFYSYAHEDEKLRDQLEQHLSPLQRQGLIQPWYDRDIRAGSEWRPQIDTHLDEAQLILLLISPAFIHSDFCYTIELPRAMARHHSGEAWVIPIHLHPVDWQGAVFAALQALPTDAKAVTEWRNRNLAFKTIVRGIRQAAEMIRGTGASTPIVHAPLTPKVPVLTNRVWVAGALLILAAVAGVYLYTQHIAPVNQRLAEGKWLLSIGRYDQAKAVYQKASERGWYGQWAARLGLAKARMYDFENGAFSAAEVTQRIDHLFKQHRNDPHAYLFKGDLAALDEDFEQAATFYRQAIQHDPALAQAYFNLGVVYDRLGRAESALERYEKAVELAPLHSPYLINLAHAYAQLHRDDQAVRLYERALRRAPNLLITHFDLARLYRRLGDPDKALWHLEQGAWGLDDPDVAHLEQNRQPWSFSLEDQSQPLPLDNLARKRCYAYRTLAATLRGLGRAAAAEPYTRKPCDLPPGEEQIIQSWVNRETRVVEP